MRYLGFILLSGLLAFGTQSAAERSVLRVATGEYAPFTDPNDADGGLVNGNVRDIAEAAGYAAEFDYMPWMRALELTRMARYSATSYWYYQAEREADFIHVGPVNVDRLVLFTRVGRELPEWNEVSDLSEITIGAVPGYTYTDDFWSLAEAGGLNVETAQSDESNLRKLLAGRIDAYPMSEEGGRVLMERIFSADERAQIVFEPQALLVTNGYLLIPRTLENAERIASDLQKALDEREAKAR